MESETTLDLFIWSMILQKSIGNIQFLFSDTVQYGMTFRNIEWPDQNSLNTDITATASIVHGVARYDAKQTTFIWKFKNIALFLLKLWTNYRQW